MNIIWVIGTQPPCPRCKLLTKAVEAKVFENEISAVVRHLAYTDAEAIEFAKGKGLEPGTAKDVAKAINQEIDMSKLTELLKDDSCDDSLEYSKYNDCNWSYKLDEFLRPYENVAVEVGIMMTPVLIINGEIIHQGSVPSLTKLEKWLKELK